MPSRTVIDRLLAQPHVVLVGLSRHPKDFSHAVAKQLRASGHEVVGVNPEGGGDDDTTPCYRSLADVPDPVDWVLVMVPADRAAAVVDEAVTRGVRGVWLHQGAGRGAVSEEAVARAREAGVDLVDGACPLMFAEPVAAFHKVHRWFVRRRVAA